MGSLAIPASGSLYMDTQSFIYTVERFPNYSMLLRPLWAAVVAGTLRVRTSEITLMECLVVPYRRADPALVADFESLLSSAGVDLIPITPDILRAAARLRAIVTKLRTPDAIQAATALASPCAGFVTNDRGFGSIPGLPILNLDAALAAP